MQELIEYLRWAVLNKETLAPTEKFQIADILEKYMIEYETRERFEKDC